MVADLNDFVYKQVLGGDPTRKSLFILLEKGEEQAVLICNKEAFEEDDNLIPKWLKSAKLHLLTENDKYGNYEMALDPELNLLKTTLIYPANAFDIQKYRRQEFFILNETPEDYKNITCNYLVETRQFENLKWVYNFLDKKSEEERIIYENPDKHGHGFILAPDLKWNGTNLDELYLLAVAHRRDLHSIRDLTPNELPLLENIRDECAKTIEEKYGLKKSQLKCIFIISQLSIIFTFI
uniref:m7GpppX diphosphatase n=1 Tax=Meloidogyne enterolobii TaxID=390850 RepID=A0A6V7TNL2_MELEN|nr:unnamed protein product [Meloidogyne enterolobii]